MLPDRALRRLQGISSVRFIEFQTHGKKGHFTIESSEEMMRRVRGCDLPLICELRAGVVVVGSSGTAAELIGIARRTMPEDVRRAWARFHYVEHRGEHRAADHPIERGDPVASLAAMNACISHALQAASVIHGEPYPYVKWLYQSASKTPTGRALSPLIEQWINLLGSGALRLKCQESEHPMNMKIREMRMALIDAFVANGINEPWLKEWWLDIVSAREGIKTVEWIRP